MIWITLYLMVAVYLVGSSDAQERWNFINIMVCFIWLPVTLAFISTRLAARFFGEKSC